MAYTNTFNVDAPGSSQFCDFLRLSVAYVFNVIASVGRQNDVNAAITLKIMLGAIARSVAMSLGNQEAPRSFLASGTSFR